MHIVVIGAGYVGLVTGVSLARGGLHNVTLVERDAQRRETLREGRVPIVEPGLEEAFREATDRIAVAASLAEVRTPDLVFVTVGTQISDAGESDLAQLHSALDDLRAWPDAHVSVRSTLPPGTSKRIPELLGRPDGSRISTNPEFLRQGSAMDDFARPTRIVIGRFRETSAEHLALLDQVTAPFAAT